MPPPTPAPLDGGFVCHPPTGLHVTDHLASFAHRPPEKAAASERGRVEGSLERRPSRPSPFANCIVSATSGLSAVEDRSTPPSLPFPLLSPPFPLSPPNKDISWTAAFSLSLCPVDRCWSKREKGGGSSRAPTKLFYCAARLGGVRCFDTGWTAWPG
ncbi:hypothetical protein XA68_18374 [Ophiocordyceps unilateralis]|uniref:Uncharacterized protein n=1 Tax=Ophiocordyceps unilateralis TaxID=268505 RepID=A0A2A9P1F8_OPHUN|nr:hypothetical protein XA68_18374 [Ophiocordyceps unilateralis]